MNFTKTINIFGAFLLAFFLGWYLLVAYDNVFACDDYWFGTNVKLYGFWNYQIHHWLSWEGSFTHTFLLTVPHVFTFSRLPFLVNFISLLIFTFSCYTLVRTFFQTTKSRSFCIAQYLVIFLFLFTNGNAEIRYWMSVNFSYLIELSSVLLFICSYHKSRVVNINNLILDLLLLFIIGGSKLNFILVAIFFVFVHDIIYNYRPNKKTALYTLLFFFPVLLNVVSPGNYIRLEDELAKGLSNDSMTMIDAIFHRYSILMSFIPCTFFLLPISSSISIPKITIKKFFIIILFILLAYLAESILMFLCFNDPGPKRIYISFELIISLTMIIIWNKLYSYLSQKYHIFKAFPLFAIILVLLYNFLYVLQVPASINYAHQARLRDEMMKNHNDIKVADIPQLPKSYLILSSMANDEVWLENIYLPYFQK